MAVTTIDPNVVMWVLIALVNAYTAWLVHRTHETIGTVTKDVKEVKENILIVERATNSMKDALVAKTGEAAHAAGLEEGRIAGEEKAATLAQGVLAAKKE